MKIISRNIINFLTFASVLLSCEKETTSAKLTTYTSTNSGLTNNSVYSIAIDGQNNKWIGTCDGICKFDDSNWISYAPLKNTVNGCTWDLWINTIAIGSQSDFWVGSSEGGISNYNGTEWINQSAINGIINDSINVIAIDDLNNKWFGTSQGVSKYDGVNMTNYLIGIQVRAITSDVEGNIWFGTWGNGVFKFDGENWTNFTKNDGLVSNYIFCLAFDSHDDIWIGTNDGLTKFDGNNYLTYYPQKFSIVSIAIDRAGNKWIGTNAGVKKFDDKNWTTYLDNTQVTSIVVDEFENIWFGTYDGLTVLKNN